MSLGLLALCALPCLAAEPVITAQGLPEDKLVMLAPQDGGFETAMATILKDKHDPLIEAMKQYGVVLRNDSDRAVVMFTVDFIVQTPEGPKRTGMGYGAVEDLLDGGQRRPESRYFKRRIWVIPARSFRFIGPHITMGPDDKVDDAAQRGPAAALRAQSTLDSKRAQWQDHNVTIRLTSALFEDGEAVGPEANLMATYTRNELAGYQAIFSDMTARASSGTAWGELIRSLEQVVEQNQNTDFGHTDYWRNFYAGRLLMITGQSGAAAAVEYAAQRLFHNPPEIHVGKRWTKQTAQKRRP